MTAQRRTALFSVFAALALIGLKLGTGIATGSLGVLSEAVHSGTDLIAALLTFFAVGVAVRPADTGHQYGHGKAEHLSALAEGAILVFASLVIIWRAIGRLTGLVASERRGAVVGARGDRRRARHRRRPDDRVCPCGPRVRERGAVGERASLRERLRRFGRGARRPSPRSRRRREGRLDRGALRRLLVLVAAVRLMRRNVDVLMDRVPADAEEAARLAIEDIRPTVELRRLRMRQAAGRYFADVVIGVSVDAAVGQGHAAADAVERAVQSALPEADVVVHVEPLGDRADVRERAHAAALGVPRRARGAQRERRLGRMPEPRCHST